METQIHIGGRMTVNPEDLIILKGDINYTTVYFQNGKKKAMVATTLKRFEEKLFPYSNFFRITKSTIINTKCIKNISNNKILLNNGETVIPSRRRAKVFFQLVNQ
jgi:DNA-binding LytR/AlgR family response regulator